MKKKISYILIYTVVGILTLGLILTAVLKKDFAPNITIPEFNAKAIEITDAKIAEYAVLDDKDDYNEFVDVYSDSFKLTILYSLFSGKISREQTISKFSKNMPTFNSGYIVNFYYDEEQVLKVNGKEYIDSVNSNKATTYKRVMFNVVDGNGLKTVNIYFYSEANSLWYKLTTLANFDDVADFITSELPIFAPETEE